MNWLLNREVVIGLAIAGAILATAASSLENRIGARRAMLVNRAGYGLTAVSITLFIVVRFVGSG